LIVDIGDTTTDPKLFLFLFYFIFFVQQRRCSDGGSIIISPSPKSRLTDEVRWRRVANQRVARGLCAAVVGLSSGYCRTG